MINGPICTHDLRLSPAAPGPTRSADAAGGPVHLAVLDGGFAGNPPPPTPCTAAVFLGAVT